MKLFKLLIKIFFVIFVFFLVFIFWAYFELKDDFNAFEKIQNKIINSSNEELIYEYNSSNREKIINELILEHINKKLKEQK